MFNRNALKAQIVLRGENVESVAKAIGITAPTFYRKLRRNGDFSREEISKMVTFLEIEQPDNIFFAEDGA